MPKAIQIESEVELEPIIFELQRYTLNNYTTLSPFLHRYKLKDDTVIFSQVPITSNVISSHC